MRDEPDDAVTARLRSVLPSGARPSGPPVPFRPARPRPPVTGPRIAPPPEPALFADRSPLAWSDLVPSWPDDVQLADREPARPVVTPSSTAPIDPSAWAAVRPGWGGVPVSSPPAGPPPVRSGAVLADSASSHPGFADRDRGDRASCDPAEAASEAAPGGFDPGSSAFGGGPGRFGAFDPGRRGVRALAAVAAVVVLIAAFLAWRARPQVDPVPALPVAGAPDPGAPDPGAPGVDAPAASGSAGPEVVVAVEGKVGKPGVVRLPAGARVADALAAAGGAQSGVDVALLNLARKVVDGELILVGVTPPPGSTVAAGPAPAVGAPAGPVNLNTATVADLDTLPGVGPVLAQRILDARTARGGFRAVTDLRRVEGIGAARFEQLKDLVTV